MRTLLKIAVTFSSTLLISGCVTTNQKSSILAQGDSVKTERSAPALEKNNEWKVVISNKKTDRPPELIYASVVDQGSYWAVKEFTSTAPRIPKTEPIELFATTPDLQVWFNVYDDMVGYCDSIEVKTFEFHTVCSSSLADKKIGAALLGALLGLGNGKIGFGYTDSKVEEVIRSIRPQEAQQKLLDFEKGLIAKKEEAQRQEREADAENERKLQAMVELRRKAPIGAKDWCEQVVKRVGPGLQVESNYECQVYGVITEDILREEGWAIINKTSKDIGYKMMPIIVQALSIEKVPR